MEQILKCENVTLGVVKKDHLGRFVGYYKGRIVIVSQSIPNIYKHMRKLAFNDGLLIRDARGLYHAPAEKVEVESS